MDFTKDPDATLDYTLIWVNWLDDDLIVASEWLVPVGLVKSGESFTTTITTVWLSGGTVRNVYSVVNRITTAGGRIDDRKLMIAVEER